jgi:cytochrome b subunit of formate dehydrogenase
MTSPLSASERGDGQYLWRFSPLERVLHGLVIVSFLALVITGIPLHFSTAPWARGLVRLMGGFEAAGLVHRVGAIITFAYFSIHIGTLTSRLIRSTDKTRMFWGPDSMVPQPKDVRDLLQMFRWFVGRGPRPQFDRFSYMEKFDYLAVFWGVAIIGGSGLLLWFPVLSSRVFPGWVFNVATIIHGDEALLALGFIFTIHFFNVHLRPGKFPIDVVIFTGRATADYMKEEHPLEYERLAGGNRLEELRAPPSSRAVYLWSLGIGFVALALGLTMLGLIFWALLS